MDTSCSALRPVKLMAPPRLVDLVKLVSPPRLVDLVKLMSPPRLVDLVKLMAPPRLVDLVKLMAGAALGHPRLANGASAFGRRKFSFIRIRVLFFTAIQPRAKRTILRHILW